MPSIDNVQDLTPRVQYSASGGQTIFPYPFPIFEDDNLVVYDDDDEQALATDYTVSGAGDDNGGNVTFLSGRTAGHVITIYRDIPIERLTDFQQNGPNASSVMNDELDRLHLYAQEQELRIARTVKLSPLDTAADDDLELPDSSDRAGRYFAFDANGRPSMATGTGNDPDLRADLADATTAGLGNNLIAIQRTAAEIAAGVTPVNHTYPEGDVRRYGTNTTPGTTDMTTALVNAGKSSLNPYVPVDVGNLLVTGSLAAGLQSGQRWHGGGTIVTANGFNHHVFEISGKTDVTVDGINGVAGTLGAAYSVATARFFRAVSGSHRCKLLNSRVTGFQSAAQLNASEHCQVVGNDIIDPDGWGVNVQTDAHDAIVAHNRISGVVNEHGIYVSGTSGDRIRSPHIHNNTVTDSAIDGIKVTHCDDPHVHDNTSYSNGGQGIYVTVGVNRSNVHDNSSYSNGENGVLVFTSTAADVMDKNHVHHNHCFLNQNDGVRVQVSNASATVSNTIVEENVIDDNNQAAGSFRGISLAHSAGTISGTIVARNKIYNEDVAINVASSVASSLIESNEFSGNTTDIADAGTGTRVRQPGSVQTLTGAGAVSLLTELTYIVTTGANALTLADGYAGQRKLLVMKTDAGDGTLTPTNLYNGTTITFNDVGDSADLVFMDGQWVFMGGTATLA